MAGAAPVATCAGTLASPGVLVGDYWGTVNVAGVCFINQGHATVHGTLVIGQSSTLVAAFGLNDATGTGNSGLTVKGNVLVEPGSTMLMGCEPGYFTCIDDPSQTSPTLFSRGFISGSLIEHAPLGVVVHASSIEGNVSEIGGGGGVNCTPTGPFAAFGSPVYSDYEDTSVGGTFGVQALDSCWLGVARDQVRGNALFRNVQLADPDGVEIIASHFGGNLACYDNSMVWDSFDLNPATVYPRQPDPNRVDGSRLGQCVLSSAKDQGGPLGPGPF